MQELTDLRVGLLHEEHVGVGAQPDAESALLPAGHELPLALLVGDLQGALVQEVELEAEVGFADPLPDRRVVGLARGDHLRRHRAVVGGHDVVGGPLEDRQVAGLLGDQRDGLDGAGARADHADPKAREVHVLVRPAAGVVRAALKRVDARELGCVRRRQCANGGNHVARGDDVAAVGRHRPDVRGIVERGRRDPRLELNVFAEVKALGHVLEVSQDLVLLGIALAPLPLLQQFLIEGVAVDIAVGVAAGAGVPVPVPRAANTTAGFIDAYRQAHLVAEPVQHVQAGETGTNNDGIELRGPPHTGRHLKDLLWSLRAGPGHAVDRWAPRAVRTDHTPDRVPFGRISRHHRRTGPAGRFEMTDSRRAPAPLSHRRRASSPDRQRLPPAGALHDLSRAPKAMRWCPGADISRVFEHHATGWPRPSARSVNPS